MQQCTMNGDTFKRLDDGRLYLNGQEIIENKVNYTGFTQDEIKLMFFSFAAGMMVASLVTLITVI